MDLRKGNYVHLPNIHFLFPLHFDDLQLSSQLLESLDSMGYIDPTPVQQQVIPPILEGKDVIACAQTGTGKTAAYLLPVLDKIIRGGITHTSAVIISPTRELALQIDNAFQGFAYFTHASSIAVYGGSDGQVFEQEKTALTNGASVVIATPGRLLSHLSLGYVKFNQIDFLVLDEADKMLDMGFHDDILRIISFLPVKRQNLLFSATMPSRIRDLARKIMQHPVEVNIAISKPAAGVKQQAYVLYESQKSPLLVKLVGQHPDSSILIFASTKANVKSLEKELLRKKMPVRAIHSDLSQQERESVLLSFRNRSTRILVATDILSRGIDIENIGMVINYDVPGDAEDYVHRVGRTARAESTGEAVTLISEKDMKRFAQIEALIESVVPKLTLPSDLGPAPEWNPAAARKHRSNHKKNFRKSKSGGRHKGHFKSSGK
ncbi:MAG: DEAD/DEAH box helicase [Bacteroidia bacterium]|nr:DEAD/DEAH box helicase [Bacteroidia bacterium]